MRAVGETSVSRCYGDHEGITRRGRVAAAVTVGQMLAGGVMRENEREGENGTW